MNDLSSQGFRPAQGLKVLTWPQIEQIDDLVYKLCTQTRVGRVAVAILTVANGHLKGGTITEPMVDLVPNRR